MILLLLVALVVLAYCVGVMAEKWRRRPPEIPSTAYFLERDWEPGDEPEMRRRLVREAMRDWGEAYYGSAPW